MLILSNAIKGTILRDIERFCRTVRKAEPEEALSFILSERYLLSQADYYLSVMGKLGLDTDGKKILEIGSGYGFFLVYAVKKLGWDIYGVEPGEGEFSGRFEVAQRILDENGIDRRRLINSKGEDIKLESDKFDIVISNDVLEHVEDTEKVIQEAYRMLKPGGILIFNMPNYRWFYEGHYNMFWIPSISKTIARRYVSLRGRDTDYMNHLKFLTPLSVSRMVKRIPDAEVCLPLNYGVIESMLERVRVYIECKEKRKARGAGEYILKFLYAVASTKFFKGLMQTMAKLTGIHHEIHLVILKGKRRNVYGHG